MGEVGGEGGAVAGAASARHTRLPISLKEHVRRENTDNQCQISQHAFRPELVFTYFSSRLTIISIKLSVSINRNSSLFIQKDNLKHLIFVCPTQK